MYHQEEAICNICLEKVRENTYILSNFYTVPHLRGKEIGKSLLKTVLKTYVNRKFILFVDVENVKAIKLYKGLGFYVCDKVGSIESKR